MTPHLTLYRGARQPVPIAQDDFADWPEVVASLEDLVSREAPEPSANDLQFANGDRKEAMKLNLLAFAPHRLSEPYRKLTNVLEVTMMVIDVDVVADLDALVARLAELRVDAFMYESPSSTPDAPRVRIVAPLSRPIAVNECRGSRLAFAEALGLEPGCGVEGAIDAAKLFFAGRYHGDPPRRTWKFEAGA